MSPHTWGSLHSAPHVVCQQFARWGDCEGMVGLGMGHVPGLCWGHWALPGLTPTRVIVGCMWLPHASAPCSPRCPHTACSFARAWPWCQLCVLATSVAPQHGFPGLARVLLVTVQLQALPPAAPLWVPGGLFGYSDGNGPELENGDPVPSPRGGDGRHGQAAIARPQPAAPLLGRGGEQGSAPPRVCWGSRVGGRGRRGLCVGIPGPSWRHRPGAGLCGLQSAGPRARSSREAAGAFLDYHN